MTQSITDVIREMDTTLHYMNGHIKLADTEAWTRMADQMVDAKKKVERATTPRLLRFILKGMKGELVEYEVIMRVFAPFLNKDKNKETLH